MIINKKYEEIFNVRLFFLYAPLQFQICYISFNVSLGVIPFNKNFKRLT